MEEYEANFGEDSPFTQNKPTTGRPGLKPQPTAFESLETLESPFNLENNGRLAAELQRVESNSVFEEMPFEYGNLTVGEHIVEGFQIMPSEANPSIWETENTYFPSSSEQFGQEMGEKEPVPESVLYEILSEINESERWQSDENLIDALPGGEVSLGNSYEIDPYAEIRPALTPKYANLAADEISHQLGPMPAMLALHEQLVSSNLRKVVLAALLGKAGRRSFQASGKNISPDIYLRQISRLCSEAAEQYGNAIRAEFTGELTSGLRENEAVTSELEDFVQSYLKETQGWTAETENLGELWTAQEVLPNNPAQLDCSGVEIPDPDKISQEDKKSFKSGGSLAQGKANDRTGETLDALKAMHLTHYNVNEWEPRKEVHRATLSDLTIFIREHLSRNRDDILKVTITGSCSKTGSESHNKVLSCRRSKAAARLMKLGLEGFGARLIFDTSGQGFTQAKCKGNDCEIPDYRAVLVTIHKPDKIPSPLSPELPGSCTYKIRCCSFKQELLFSALLSDLLDKTLPEDVKRLLEQYPLLKKILKVASDKLISLLRKLLPKLAKLEKVFSKLLKYVYVEFIRVKAVFQIAERNTANSKIVTLCYMGYGIRVKMPDINLAVDQMFIGSLVPDSVKNMVKKELKAVFKTELGIEHLEGNCAPAAFENFDLVKLVGSNNTPVCTKRNISIFQGAASLGADVTAATRSSVGLSFDTPEFTSLTGIRLGNCSGDCSRHMIMLPLGKSKGFEFFLATTGTLSANVECKCVECDR